MRLFTPLSTGGAIVVSSPDEIYDGPGDLTVDLVSPDQRSRRWIGRRKLLADHAPIEGGGVDLLVHDTDRRGVVRSLSLIARLVSEGVDGPPRLRLATAANALAPIRDRRVVGVLPGWLERSRLSYGMGLDVALDGADRVTIALTAAHEVRSVLVLATGDLRGRRFERQATSGVEGMVALATAPTGRTAVLVEDTGIEGEVGECVEDGQPRRIHAAVREPRAARFSAVRLLHQSTVSCDAAGAHLVVAPDGATVALWGALRADQHPRKQMVKGAVAPPGAPFGDDTALWGGGHLEAATFDASGTLSVLASSLGRLVARRTTASGTPGWSTVLDPDGGDALAVQGPDGRAWVVWTRKDETRQLAVGPPP